MVKVKMFFRLSVAWIASRKAPYLHQLYLKLFGNENNCPVKKVPNMQNILLGPQINPSFTTYQLKPMNESYFMHKNFYKITLPIDYNNALLTKISEQNKKKENFYKYDVLFNNYIVKQMSKAFNESK